MEDNKILSVEEILVNNEVFKEPEIKNFNLIFHRDCYMLAQRNIKRAMIEFAKMHVKAALKQASTIEVDGCGCGESTIILDYMQNCYPLENIK